MSLEVIGPEAEACLSWDGLVQALIAGHRLPRAEIADTFLYRGQDTQLNRAAWIDGLGQLVKTATIFPGNPARGKPTVNGGVCLYGDATGELEAVIDFHLVTKWKTAGDSLLSARQLARQGLQLFLQPLQQGKGIGGRSGETGHNIAPARRKAAHLARRALDYRLAKADLTIARHHDHAAPPYCEDGRAVPAGIALVRHCAPSVMPRGPGAQTTARAASGAPCSDRRIDPVCERCLGCRANLV